MTALEAIKAYLLEEMENLIQFIRKEETKQIGDLSSISEAIDYVEEQFGEDAEIEDWSEAFEDWSEALRAILLKVDSET